ncbi:MAG: DJ-1/PfpI family protein [Planctomycetota bacterium]
MIRVISLGMALGILLCLGCAKESEPKPADQITIPGKSSVFIVDENDKPINWSTVGPTRYVRLDETGKVIIEDVSSVTPTKAVAMIIASQKFRDEEYEVTRKVLEQAGVKITVFSSVTTESKGMLGKVVKPDKLLAELKAAEFDAIIFVGGTGSEEYFNSAIAHQIALDAVKENKVLAAICLAPAILANAGVLKDKSATVFPSEADRLKSKGASYKNENVCVDGRIITGNGPEASTEFARAILTALK